MLPTSYSYTAVEDDVAVCGVIIDSSVAVGGYGILAMDDVTNRSKLESFWCQYQFENPTAKCWRKALVHELLHSCHNSCTRAAAAAAHCCCCQLLLLLLLLLLLRLFCCSLAM
jgi:hypothetical protein